MNLWSKAANQGNVDARVKMGDYYYYGLGLDNEPLAFPITGGKNEESDDDRP